MNEKRLFAGGIFASIFLLALLSFVSADVINCYSDSDCFSGFIGTEYCMSNDVYKVFQNSNCVNPGLSSSYCNNVGTPTLLIDCGVDSWNPWSDNYCKTDGNVYHSRNGMKRGCKIININSNISGCYFEFAYEEELVQVCSDGCSDGNCNLVVINCSINDDCGENRFIDDLFCQSNNVFQNFITYICNNPGLANSYCSNSINPLIKTDCGDNYCEDYGSNYCKDNDVYYSRNCHSKGCSLGGCFDNVNTEESLVQTCSNGCLDGNCIIENIICYDNSYCGTNNYVGDKYCYNGDVYQDYKEYECNNPGSVNSYCSNSIGSGLIEECDDSCSDGECVDKEHNIKYKFDDSEPYSYPSSINFSGFEVNESVQKISGNVIKLENENSLNKIFENNLLLILIILVIILIMLIIILSLMR